MNDAFSSRLILIGGDIASGKSTFAHWFSKTYNIMCLTKDRTKEILADAFGFKNREENYHLSQVSFKLLYEAAKNALEAKTSLILESNFRQYELDLLKELADQYNAEITSLVFTGDPHVLYKRYLDRIAAGTRHIAHQSVDFKNEAEFAALIKKMHDVKYPGRVKILNNTYFDALGNKDVFKEVCIFLIGEENCNIIETPKDI
jgi:predicted kinase